MVRGTSSDTIKMIFERIPIKKRKLVKEIILDMAASMEKSARYTFPNATLVTDRFHVQKLVYDPVQEMRIINRREAIDQENKETELAKYPALEQAYKLAFYCTPKKNHCKH